MGKKKTTREKAVGELIARQAAELTTQGTNPMSWNKVTLTKNDLIIPRLQLTQPTSDIVTVQRKAQAGEIRDNLNNSLMAKEGTTLEVIPLYCLKRFKVNKVFEAKGKIKKEFLEMVAIQDNPMEPGFNDDLPWKGKQLVEGKTEDIERIRTYEMFFIIPKLGRDVAYVMSFASTNIKAAKNIMLQMALNQEAGKTPAAYCFNLDINTKSNEDSTWYVIDATLGREATEEEQGKAFKWYKRVQGGEAKVHSDEEIG